MHGFRAREEGMIPTGLPRNDVLYNTTPEEVIPIKKQLGLHFDKNSYYTPT